MQNALDRQDPSRSQLVDSFLSAQAEHGINVIKSKGVQSEIQNPQTPTKVRSDMDGLYTLSVQQTDRERDRRQQVIRLLTGNATPGKHQADADHLFEAEKYGAGYFITHDKRILGKKAEIEKLLGPGFTIVELKEFVAICDALS